MIPITTNARVRVADQPGDDWRILAERPLVDRLVCDACGYVTTQHQPGALCPRCHVGVVRLGWPR